jgi:hypothetical protein
VSLLTLIPQGNIGGIDIDATLEEVLHDSLQVTEHPVEAGALITDHSFQRPCELVLRCGWSNSSLGSLVGEIIALIDNGSASVSDYVTGVYFSLLRMQQSRVPFDVVTTIRQYKNMLMTGVQLTRDQKTSQALMVTATLREVIIVSTQSTTLPPKANQATPANTAEVVHVGVAKLIRVFPGPGTSLPSEQWGVQ